jgi:hypothetical protein
VDSQRNKNGSRAVAVPEFNIKNSSRNNHVDFGGVTFINKSQ